MRVVDFDPAKGQAFQGDVAIVAVPADLAAGLNRSDPVPAEGGRLILLEGELTGHHHAVDVLERPAQKPKPVRAADPGLVTAMGLRHEKGAPALFRDTALADRLVRANILARADLCVAFLTVEGGFVTVSHPEHDGIRLPEGCFYVGRQIESAGEDERRVAD